MTRRRRRNDGIGRRNDVGGIVGSCLRRNDGIGRRNGGWGWVVVRGFLPAQE